MKCGGTSLRVGAVVVGCGLMMPWPASAGTYSVTELANTFAQFQQLPAPAVVASNGRAIFRGKLDDGTVGFFTGDYPVADAVATTRDGFKLFGNFPAINAHGQVAFSAQLNDGTDGIFLGPRPQDLAVATSADFAVESNPQLDDNGRAAFVAVRDGKEVIASVSQPGGPVTILAQPDSRFDSISNSFCYNHQGMLAFFAESGGKMGLYVSNTGFADDAVQVAQEGGFITDLRENSTLEPPSVNSHGDVAFMANLSDGNTAILTGGDQQDVLVQTGGDFTRLSTPLMRDDARVLFWAGALGHYGVYDSSDAASPVLTEDDIGAAVGRHIDIMYFSNTIAEDGTIGIMTVGETADGVALIRPVPEPALLGLCAGGLLLLRRRRESPESALA